MIWKPQVHQKPQNWSEKIVRISGSYKILWALRQRNLFPETTSYQYWSFLSNDAQSFQVFTKDYLWKFKTETLNIFLDIFHYFLFFSSLSHSPPNQAKNVLHRIPVPCDFLLPNNFEKNCQNWRIFKH